MLALEELCRDNARRTLQSDTDVHCSPHIVEFCLSYEHPARKRKHNPRTGWVAKQYRCCMPISPESDLDNTPRHVFPHAYHSAQLPVVISVLHA